MKCLPFSVIITFAYCAIIAQSPENIDEALQILNNRCSDSLKSQILITEVSGLTKLFYPWGGDNKTLMNFTSHEEKLEYQEYYESQEIYSRSHINLITLVAFKRKLQGLPIKHDSIVGHYKVIDRKWKYEDENKFSVDSIRGVYIPKNLEDCFTQINSFWDGSTKIKVKNWTENEFTADTHFGFGLWMRNNWRLWAGSRLSKYFNAKGIYHPDDMSGIVLTSYHRYLNGKDIRLKNQIKYYQRYWKKSNKEQEKTQKALFNEFIVGDTVEFKYDYDFISEMQEDQYMNSSCNATGLVLEKNRKELLLLIRLLDPCDPSGIISLKYDRYDQKSQELIEKGATEIMKKGEGKWMRYALWY